MKRLSQAFSTLGLLSIVAGIVLLPEGTELRWDRLVIGVIVGFVCFIIAARLAKSTSSK